GVVGGAEARAWEGGAPAEPLCGSAGASPSQSPHRSSSPSRWRDRSSEPAAFLPRRRIRLPHRALHPVDLVSRGEETSPLMFRNAAFSVPFCLLLRRRSCHSGPTTSTSLTFALVPTSPAPRSARGTVWDRSNRKSLDCLLLAFARSRRTRRSDGAGCFLAACVVRKIRSFGTSVA